MNLILLMILAALFRNRPFPIKIGLSEERELINPDDDFDWRW